MKEYTEKYLKCIYRLNEAGNEVGVVDVAKCADVTKPSATSAVKELKMQGYVKQARYGKIHLTVRGMEAAKKLCDRRKLLTDFFNATLDVDESIIEDNVRKIEIYLETEVINAMKKYLKTVDIQS